MKLEGDALNKELSALSGWRIEHEALVHEFTFENFVQAMAFVNMVAERAEAMGHHPDMHISYNRVRLELSTHDEGGITKRDTDLAAEINRTGL